MKSANQQVEKKFNLITNYKTQIKTTVRVLCDTYLQNKRTMKNLMFMILQGYIYALLAAQ